MPGDVTDRAAIAGSEPATERPVAGSAAGSPAMGSAACAPAVGSAAAGPAMGSAGLADAIAGLDLRACCATVVGYGSMGRQYVEALRRLGVGRIRVVSRSAAAMEPLRDLAGVETISGGLAQLTNRAEPGELAIVAAPMSLLSESAKQLAALGYRSVLIEKPIALSSSAVQSLNADLASAGVDAWCAYNRVAYPSVIEARSLAQQDGGVTSCIYTFTEVMKPDWLTRFSVDELAHWGIANSLHVMSLAHTLIGPPDKWHAQRSGSLEWHASGRVFVGSGSSETGIPFASHADWGSAGRWCVDIFTSKAAYRLCPLERLAMKTSPFGEWQDVPVRAYADDIKAGIAEEIAAALHPKLRRTIPLVSLPAAIQLMQFAEDVFGY